VKRSLLATFEDEKKDVIGTCQKTRLLGHNAGARERIPKESGSCLLAYNVVDRDTRCLSRMIRVRLNRQVTAEQKANVLVD
jgi:hypothetical protein